MRGPLADSGKLFEAAYRLLGVEARLELNPPLKDGSRQLDDGHGTRGCDAKRDESPGLGARQVLGRRAEPAERGKGRLDRLTVSLR